jgi:hypothetical protein
LVALGDDIVNLELEVGKRGLDFAHVVYGIVETGKLLPCGSFLLDEVRAGIELLKRLWIPFVPDLFEVTADDCLVLFCRHIVPPFHRAP